MILTRRFAPGDKLPSQPEIAARYGVARETVKRALEVLRAERLIISRQGSGVFVRAQTQRPVELRPHIEAAFDRPHVTVDFAGFSGETLRDALAEVLDKVRVGRLAPESIAIRVLVSDMSAPTAVPARAEAQGDDAAVRERAERITRRAVDGIILDQVAELGDPGLVRSATVEARPSAGRGGRFVRAGWRPRRVFALRGRLGPDPLEMLRWVVRAGDRRLLMVAEDALCAAEIPAAATAEPPPFGRKVIVGARQVGLPGCGGQQQTRLAR
ncbi:hypothetical protein GCM10023170_044720 [Phytohabitans houttuyneae]|uniref:HTH gntR-type domain-containing protein n=1 Tax=Phytohabitans houttuyneae TaxID=1076126 RepID=A0A6V8K8C7_9ACTN|nr:hypothetical protein Phou_041940 [Phytohabitans houttuyneae]